MVQQTEQQGPSKQQWRTTIRARRRDRDAAQRAALAYALAEQVETLPAVAGITVAAYIPTGDEPGDLNLLNALRAHGADILVPVIAEGEPAPLHWAHYGGPETLAAGRFGILAPTSPSLGPETVHQAALVLVPALAVDVSGTRLGRGAGYYDRSLPYARGQLAAVVYDDEIVDHLPADEHDHRVQWALTPHRGLIALSGHTTALNRV